jgi:hypothetical protein
MKIQSQQNQIDDLTSQNSALRADLKSAQSTNKTPAKTQTQTTTTTYKSSKGVEVALYKPATNARVSNPVAVLGEVPGSWSSEAQFPVILKDSTGRVIARATGQVLGDWMTDQLVPFSAKLVYSGAPTGTGTLVLERDNPSGMATNDDFVTIPIRF